MRATPGSGSANRWRQDAQWCSPNGWSRTHAGCCSPHWRSRSSRCDGRAGCPSRYRSNYRSMSRPVSAAALTLDLIIPLYNEAEVLDLLFETLDRTFSPENLARRNVAAVRYLFVDDGSSDSSASIISERIRAGAPAALYRLSRNFGHANAVSAGI